MKRLTRGVLALGLMVTSGACVPYCGSPCPDEQGRLPLRSGEYQTDRASESGAPVVFETGSDFRLNIDRDNGTATLSFVDDQGRTVEIDYLSRAEAWENVSP